MSWWGSHQKQQETEGNGTRELSDMNQGPQGLPVPSFTPINLNLAPAPFPFINPLNTRHDRALDSDSFYDLAPDDITAAQPKGKRRASAAARNGRFIPSNAYPAYQEDENLPFQNQDVELSASPNKKPKAKRSKRSKSERLSVKAPNENWDREEFLTVTEEATQAENYRTSQLTTPPPDTQRYPMKQKERSKTASRSRKMGPFKNPVLTKPIALTEPQIYHKEGASCSKPVVNHLGWTTTQEAAKLSKTTLDKLAAFKYRHTSNEQPSKVISAHLPVNDKFDGSPDRCQERKLPRTSDNITSYNYLLKDESLRQPQGQDFSIPVEVYHSTQMQAQAQSLKCSAYNEGIYQSQTNTFFEEALWDSTNRPGKSVEITSLTRKPRDYGINNAIPAPTFSSSIERGPGATTESSGQVQSSAVESSGFPLQLGAYTFETMRQSYNYDDPTSSEAKVTEEMACKINADGHNIIQKSHLPLGSVSVDGRDPAGEESHILMEVRVLRSAPHPEIITQQAASRELDVDVDDFDDGIADEDLLDLQPINNIPYVRSNSSNINGADFQAPKNHLLDDSSKLVSLSRANETDLSETAVRKQNLAQLPPTVSCEPDDEYPLAEGDEEEMLNLYEDEIGGFERYQASQSVHHVTGEVFDRSLQSSPPISVAALSPRKAAEQLSTNHNLVRRANPNQHEVILVGDEDWSVIHSNIGRSGTPTSGRGSQTRTPAMSPLKSQQPPVSSAQEIDQKLCKVTRSQQPPVNVTKSREHAYILDDSAEYEPLKPFARPDFPSLIRDRSPIVGFSTETFIRVCFRVGEMFKEGGRCDALNLNAVIELYARVTLSSREAGTTKQHFQFADLWHDRPPYPTGVLLNYKTSGLAETESKVFVGATESLMARCFGTLKRNNKSPTGWLLEIVSIRQTDWEELRWTKRIVSAGPVKTERSK